MIKNPVIYLRISYWMGAILDAKVAIILFFPNLIPQLYIAMGGDPGAITPQNGYVKIGRNVIRTMRLTK